MHFIMMRNMGKRAFKRLSKYREPFFFTMDENGFTMTYEEAEKICGNATRAQPAGFEVNIQIEFARGKISAGKLHETRNRKHLFEIEFGLGNQPRLVI